MGHPSRVKSEALGNMGTNPLWKQRFCLFHTPPDWHYCYMDHWPIFVQAHHPFAEVVSVRQCETVGWSFENSPRQKTVKRCEKHQVFCMSFWHQWCIKPCQYLDLNYQPQLVIAAFQPSTVCKACFFASDSPCMFLFRLVNNRWEGTSLRTLQKLGQSHEYVVVKPDCGVRFAFFSCWILGSIGDLLLQGCPCQ